MKARDVMNTRVTAATPRAIGRDLALQLLSGMYSGLPVVDPKGKVVGVVTEFDLLKAIHEGRDLQTTKAEEIMSKPVVCAQEDEEIDAIIAKMTEEKHNSSSDRAGRWKTCWRHCSGGYPQPHDRARIRYDLW